VTPWRGRDSVDGYFFRGFQFGILFTLVLVAILFAGWSCGPLLRRLLWP